MDWVLLYRIQGLSIRQIMKRLEDEHGVTVSHTTVHEDITEGLAIRQTLTDEQLAEWRTTQQERYEYLLAKLMPRVAAGDVGAANAAVRCIKGIREMHGLDRKVGSPERPLTIQRIDDTDYDWSQLTDEDLERFAELEEKAKIIPFPHTGTE